MRYLAGIAVFLFASGYWICEAFFVNGSTPWWDLRLAIYTLIFALCFGIAWKLTTGVIKAVFLTGIVFCIGDILDRYIFDIQTFHINDLLLWIFAIFYIKTAYARETKAGTR